MESTKYRRVWHKGPPPHVGWWNASTQRDSSVWRWWDGTNWSVLAGNTMSPYSAGARAKKMWLNSGQLEMEWSDYWPENARVPRIDPRMGVPA